jgi:hypothetical protein
MKFNAMLGAGIGGLVGIIVGLLIAASKYNFSNVQEMQRAVGSILVDFIVGAVVGWFIGRGTEKK